MELQGIVCKVNDVKTVQTKNGSTFTSRDFVIEFENNAFKKKACFTIIGEERCNRILPSVGEQVKVYFDLESKEWNEKYFTTLYCWKMEILTIEDASPKKPQIEAPKEEKPQVQEQQAVASVIDDDDPLPF